MVKGDITSVRVALWNAGKESVEGKVRKPVVIYTEPPVPILKVALIPFAKDDVTGLQLGTEQLAQGCVRVMWDELEKGEGASIDLLYNGSPDVKISISGSVRGQKEISIYQNKIGYDSPMEEYEDARWHHRNARLLSPVLIFASTVGLVVCLLSVKKTEDRERRKNLFYLILCLLVIIASSLGMYLTSEDPVPPLTLHRGP